MCFNKIILKMFLLSLCFSIMLTGCVLKNNKNGIYGNGIEYVEEEKCDTKNLIIDNGEISGFIGNNIKVDISETLVLDSASMIKYNLMKYNPDIIKELFFKNEDIISEEFENNDSFPGYLRGGISSEKARSILNEDGFHYTTERVRDRDVARIIKSQRISIRKDIAQVFCKPIPDGIDVSAYKEKTEQILNTLNIEYYKEPVLYYIDRETLAEENAVFNDSEINFDADYVLVFYDDFSIDDMPIYDDMVNWMHAGEWSEMGVISLFNIENDEMEYFETIGMYDSTSIEKQNNDNIINVVDALSVAAHYFDKSNLFNDVFISDTKLSYVPIYENGQMFFVPSWVFSFSSFDSENNKNILIKNVFINAFSGKVML